jgi:hypothetical protein
MKKAVEKRLKVNHSSSPFPYAGITQIRSEGIISDIPHLVG